VPTNDRIALLPATHIGGSYPSDSYPFCAGSGVFVQNALSVQSQQLTKEYPARLIVSDSMMAALGAAAEGARSLGAVAVKGYAEPVPIWGLD
jgi:hypothetical protein